MKMNYEKEMASVLKQAMAESRRRGRMEEKMEVAIKMMETGICFEEIYMFTGMKKEEIMFELDGLISAVRQADRHEHSKSDSRMDETDDPRTKVEAKGREISRGEAQWAGTKTGNCRTDKSADPWTRIEAEGREKGRCEAPWAEAGTRGCRTDESADPWTGIEAEGREKGRGEAPWMSGSEDPWAEEDWKQGVDEDPRVEENPEDWRPVAEDGPWINELSKEHRTNGKVEAWMNEQVGANLPNLWAKGKQGGKRHESEFPWRLGKMEDLLSGKISKQAVEDTAGMKTTGMETAGVETVAVNEELKEVLVRWRREQCRAEDVRAYMIIPQRTLLEIAAKIPKTRDELMAINGFGNARWEKYGEKILQMTSEF